MINKVKSPRWRRVRLRRKKSKVGLLQNAFHLSSPDLFGESRSILSTIFIVSWIVRSSRTMTKRTFRNSAKVKSSIKNLNFLILNCIFAFCILSFEFLCYAQPVSSNELINNAKQYDGKTVVYQGEVIGDIMKRGGFAWVNVNDGVNAIGIWLDKSLIKDMVYTGSYKLTGDIIEVEGVFHNRCIEHGGDLDIHAQAIRKIKSGEVRERRVDIYKRNLAFSLLGVLCLILILIQLKRG